jgi:mRNA-degrading endonuclease RelE of RelBE toxin-antitoxin system
LTHELSVSSTFARQFKRLPADSQRRIRKGLAALRTDPFTPRSGADIKRMAGTDPVKHRLRIGDFRLIYTVDGRAVKVIELFTRGRGYRFD